VQRIFNYDKIQDTSFTVDKVLNSLTYLSPFCVIIHTLQTYKNGRNFVAHPVYSKHYRISQYTAHYVKSCHSRHSIKEMQTKQTSRFNTQSCTIFNTILIQT